MPRATAWRTATLSNGAFLVFMARKSGMPARVDCTRVMSGSVLRLESCCSGTASTQSSSPERRASMRPWSTSRKRKSMPSRKGRPCLVGVIALQGDMRALHPLNDLERTGADGLALGAWRLDRLLIDDLPVVGHVGEEGRERRLQVEDRLRGARGFDAGHRREQRGIPARGLRVGDPLEAVTTSSAVNASPFWKVALSTRSNTHVFSSVCSHLVASTP